MSKFMTIAGIILAAVAVALGLMIFFSPSSVVGWGVTPQSAIELLIGGILAVGLGGVIAAVDDRAETRPPRALLGPTPERTIIRASEVAAVTTVAPAVADDGLSPATSETLRALDQAESQIKKAFGEAPAEPVQVAVEPAPPAPAPAEAEPEDSAAPAEEEAEAAPEDDDGQLYVVEERVVRGRPARVLSDGTIEAETDEGWMRFENTEHLNEYLDAMSQG